MGFGFTLAREGSRWLRTCSAAALNLRPVVLEHRQVDLARERLGGLDIQIERSPGGHLTTHEQPEALAALISEFERTVRR